MHLSFLLFLLNLLVNSVASQDLPRDRKSLEAENERLRSEVRELKRKRISRKQSENSSLH